MSTSIDERVAKLRFDNQQFEQGIKQSSNSLEKFKDLLNFSDVRHNISSLTNSFKNFSLSPLENSVNKLVDQFSLLGYTVLKIKDQISSFAIESAKSLTMMVTGLDGVVDGFREYETQINSVQTILSNTRSKGTTLDQVNAALDELNEYADKTIYNFTEMTRNIGTFTAAGVDLETSTAAIKGIANLAAVSGSTSQQASTAMYQLSQALASGTVKLMDWNSVVNAGMGGQVFQDALKETARVHGIAIDDMIAKEGSFRETLHKGWLSNEILTETLQKFTGDLNEEQLRSIGYTEEQIKSIQALGQDANDAATKVKTLTQLKDTLAEALGSGWTQSWEIIVGDFEEARELYTSISKVLEGMINEASTQRNTFLEDVFGSKKDQKIYLKDWESFSNSGLASDSFKESLLYNARSAGVAIDDLISQYGSFEASLQAGWLTKEMFQSAVDWNARSTEMHFEWSKGLVAQIAEGFYGNEEETREAIEAMGYNYDLYKSLADKYLNPEEYGELDWDAIWNDDEMLDALGVKRTTEEFQAMHDAIENSDSALSKLLSSEEGQTGREIMLEGLGNVAQTLIDLFNILKQAWSEVFPPVTVETVQSLIEKFRDFTETLALNEEKSQKFHDIFVGVFSVLGIITDVVGAVGKAFSDAFGLIFKTVAPKDLLGTLADFANKITAFRESLKADGKLVSFSSKLKKVFLQVYAVVQGIAKAIKSWFKGEDVDLKFLNIFGQWADNIQEFANGVSLKPIGDFLSKVKDFFSMHGVNLDWLDEIIEKINSSTLGDVFTSIKTFFGVDKLNFSGLKSGSFDPFTFIGNAINKIHEVLSKSGNVSTVISKITTAVKGFFDWLIEFVSGAKLPSIGDVIGTGIKFIFDLLSGLLQNVGLVLAALAAYDIGNFFVTLKNGVGGLLEVDLDASQDLLVVAGAILALAFAIDLIKDIPVEDIAKSLTSLGTGLAMIMGGDFLQNLGVTKLSNKGSKVGLLTTSVSYLASGFSNLEIAGAIAILASVIKSLAEMDATDEQITRATVVVGLLDGFLVASSSITAIVSSKNPISGFGLIASGIHDVEFARSISILSRCVISLATTEATDEQFTRATVIVGLLDAFMVASNSITTVVVSKSPLSSFISVAAGLSEVEFALAISILSKCVVSLATVEATEDQITKATEVVGWLDGFLTASTTITTIVAGKNPLAGLAMLAQGVSENQLASAISMLGNTVISLSGIPVDQIAYGTVASFLLGILLSALTVLVSRMTKGFGLTTIFTGVGMGSMSDAISNLANVVLELKEIKLEDVITGVGVVFSLGLLLSGLSILVSRLSKGTGFSSLLRGGGMKFTAEGISSLADSILKFRGVNFEDIDDGLEALGIALGGLLIADIIANLLPFGEGLFKIGVALGVMSFGIGSIMSGLADFTTAIGDLYTKLQGTPAAVDSIEELETQVINGFIDGFTSETNVKKITRALGVMITTALGDLAGEVDALAIDASGIVTWILRVIAQTINNKNLDEFGLTFDALMKKLFSNGEDYEGMDELASQLVRQLLGSIGEMLVKAGVGLINILIGLLNIPLGAFGLHIPVLWIWEDDEGNQYVTPEDQLEAEMAKVTGSHVVETDAAFTITGETHVEIPPVVDVPPTAEPVEGNSDEPLQVKVPTELMPDPVYVIDQEHPNIDPESGLTTYSGLVLHPQTGVAMEVKVTPEFVASDSYVDFSTLDSDMQTTLATYDWSGLGAQPAKDFMSGWLSNLGDTSGTYESTSGQGEAAIKGLEDSTETHSPSKKAMAIGGDVTLGLAEGIESKTGEVKSSTTTVGETALSIIRDKILEFAKYGKESINSYAQGISSGATAISRVVSDVISRTVSAFQGHEKTFYNAGLSAVQGFALGISENSSRAIDAAANVAARSLSAAKAAIDSDSPSKKFEELGLWSDQGFALGFLRNSHIVENASTKVGTSAIDRMKSAIKTVNDAMNNDLPTGPTIRPVMDLSEFQNQNSRLHKTLNSYGDQMYGKLAGIDENTANRGVTQVFIDGAIVNDTPEIQSNIRNMLVYYKRLGLMQ